MASDGLSNRQIGRRLFLSPAYGQLTPVPVLSQARGRRAPAPRDVIARASTPTTAHESTGSETPHKSFARFLDPTSAHVRDPGTWYLGYEVDELATWVRATEGPDPAKARGTAWQYRNLPGFRRNWQVPAGAVTCGNRRPGTCC